MKSIRPEANLGPANLFGVLTIIAFLTALPIALLMEGATASRAWDKAIASGAQPMQLACTIAISGLSFYLYNEVSFLALDAVDPVTHAVGNTIKVRALRNARAGGQPVGARARVARALRATRRASRRMTCTSLTLPSLPPPPPPRARHLPPIPRSATLLAVAQRVILILLSVVAFGTQMTTLSAAGSTIAIIGVFMYSIVRAAARAPRIAPVARLIGCAALPRAVSRARAQAKAKIPAKKKAA